MKNIDKIRAMSAEDLAYYLDCKCCIYNRDTCGNSCITGQTAWLNQDDNPMPKLQIGDVLEVDNEGCRYYYIGNDVAIRTISKNLSESSPIFRRRISDLKGKITKIWRENDNTGFNVFWSDGDNEDCLEKAIKEGKVAECCRGWL